jgi:hypothetical protein
MHCAMVVYLQDYEAFFDDYGLRFCLDKLAGVLDGETAHLLIVEGFERIPRKLVFQYAERGIKIADAKPVYDAIKADHPWLEKVEGLTPYLRVCFIRHLVLERWFSDGPVVSFDADVIWRYNPHRLAELWTGGSFVFDSSPCVTFAKDHSWFESYREGLRRWCVDPAFGVEFFDRSLNRKGVQHDQDLLQHLAATGQIEMDVHCPRTHPSADRFVMFANPLAVEHGLPRDQRQDIVFSREDGVERFNDRIVPFWHMQTAFSRYLAYFYIARDAVFTEGRIPNYNPQNPYNAVTLNTLKFLYFAILTGKMADAKFAYMARKLTRASLYKDFFETDLPYEIFNDRVWWKPGVFAEPRQQTDLQGALAAG